MRYWHKDFSNIHSVNCSKCTLIVKGNDNYFITQDKVYSIP